MSSLVLDLDKRAVLARIADLLIPAGETMPSASQADVQGDGIDRVLTVRPDLHEGLAIALAAFELLGSAAPTSFDELYGNPPEGFAQLAEAVTAAYFLNPDVASAVGYSKRSETPIVFDTDLDFLVEHVVERGPIYRPTPHATPKADSE